MAIIKVLNRRCDAKEDDIASLNEEEEDYDDKLSVEESWDMLLLDDVKQEDEEEDNEEETKVEGSQSSNSNDDDDDVDDDDGDSKSDRELPIKMEGDHSISTTTTNTTNTTSSSTANTTTMTSPPSSSFIQPDKHVIDDNYDNDPGDDNGDDNNKPIVTEEEEEEEPAAVAIARGNTTNNDVFATKGIEKDQNVNNSETQEESDAVDEKDIKKKMKKMKKKFYSFKEELYQLRTNQKKDDGRNNNEKEMNNKIFLAEICRDTINKMFHILPILFTMLLIASILLIAAFTWFRNNNQAPLLSLQQQYELEHENNIDILHQQGLVLLEKSESTKDKLYIKLEKIIKSKTNLKVQLEKYKQINKQLQNKLHRQRKRNKTLKEKHHNMKIKLQSQQSCHLQKETSSHEVPNDEKDVSSSTPPPFTLDGTYNMIIVDNDGQHNTKVITSKGEFFINDELHGYGIWINTKRFVCFVQRWGNGLWWIGDIDDDINESGIMKTGTINNNNELLSFIPTHIEKYEIKEKENKETQTSIPRDNKEECSCKTSSYTTSRYEGTTCSADNLRTNVYNDDDKVSRLQESHEKCHKNLQHCMGNNKSFKNTIKAFEQDIQDNEKNLNKCHANLSHCKEFSY